MEMRTPFASMPLYIMETISALRASKDEMATSKSKFWQRAIVTTIIAVTCTPATTAEALPSQLRGSWRITRILKTTNSTCWSTERAQPLVGSTLTYDDKKLHWQGGDVPLLGITTRTVTDDDLRREESGNSNPLSFAELEIHSPVITEVDFQHEDADITGASTEVPGDSVLLAAPNRIIVSACGVYMEATRAGVPHAKPHR
jgi:hypothetical protein